MNPRLERFIGPADRPAMPPLLFTVVLGCLATMAMSSCSGKPPPLSDADLVNCLGPEGTVSVAQAAVALEPQVAAPASDPAQIVYNKKETTIPSWRASAAPNFERACRAVLAANRPTSAGSASTALPWLTAVISLLAAVVGAITAGVVKAYADGGVRRWQATADLRTALVEFKQAGDAYVASWRAPGDRDDETAVVAAQDALAKSLATIRSEHGSWVLVAMAEQRLKQPPIGKGLDDHLLAAADRAAELREIEAQISSRSEAAGLAADKAAKPLRNALILRHPRANHRRQLGIKP